MSLTFAQLEGLWDAAGGLLSARETAAAIALAESSGNPSDINNSEYPDKPGYHVPVTGAQPEYSVGLWQINLLAHTQYTEEQMLDPFLNAEAAVAISNQGTDFGAWSTYANGAYKAHLATAPPVIYSRATGREAPPKPIVKPWVKVPELSGATITLVEAQPIAAWNGLWHALGHNLPFYINQSRANRRGMRAMLNLHG